VEGCCEHGNEPSGSVKGETFLEEISDYQLLRKDSVPWCCNFVKKFRKKCGDVKSSK
jgi:hypothetical protein